MQTQIRPNVPPSPDFLAACLDVLKAHARVAVIYSGDNRDVAAAMHPTYHPRHWKSYKAVAEDIASALTDIGFRRVVVLPEDARLLTALQAHDIHLAWLNTGGMQGRDAVAHAASLLEMIGLPYIGHSPLNYALLDHKLHFKRLLAGRGLPTPEFMAWSPIQHLRSPDVFRAEFARVFRGTPGPWIVKPVNGRGSRYIYTPHTEAEVLPAVLEVYGHTQGQVLVERYMAGREFCVAGGPVAVVRRDTIDISSQPIAFGSLEKLLAPDELIFSSLDQRPISQNRARLLSHPEDRPVAARLMELCRAVCTAQGIDQMIRLDLREDAEGTIHILEANPKPDLKRPGKDGSSLVALGLASAGLSYEDLLLTQIASRLYHDLCFRPGAVPNLQTLFTRAGICPTAPEASAALVPDTVSTSVCGALGTASQDLGRMV